MALLSSLSRLDGPPSHILSLLRYAYIPGTLEYLGLRLGASSFTDCFLSDVLLCTEHLPGINELSIRIPAEADPRALALPQNSSRICLAKVKDLTLRILNSESDDNTILHCARWLPTFPEIEDLYLHAQVSNLLIPRFFSTPTKIFPHFFSDSSNMDGGKLPSYKVLYHFAFHPYARIKPSAREIMMAALYDDTYHERFIPSSFAIPSSSFAISPSSFVISGSGTASDGVTHQRCLAT
ncbi:hypothetical protein EDD15DRAFT_2369768 [Pisolithus albus]|nr:hypothetical protein EDD15DRAFT_2369768 [Pisolithus albus]